MPKKDYKKRKEEAVANMMQAILDIQDEPLDAMRARIEAAKGDNFTWLRTAVCQVRTWLCGRPWGVPADDSPEPLLEVERLQRWVNDLQAGMYINCVYCGHRYGPDPGTPVAMADVLKKHIEQCPQHPMSALKKQLDDLTKPGPCGIVGHAPYWEGPTKHEPHCKALWEPEPTDGIYEGCNCDFENAECRKCREQQIFDTTIKALHIPKPGETWAGVCFTAIEGELSVHIPKLDWTRFQDGDRVKITVEKVPVTDEAVRIA